MPMFEVQMVKVTRTTVRVEARSAAEIKRRVTNPSDSYADDLFISGEVFVDDFRTPVVRLAQ